MNTPKLIVVLALVFALAMPATPVSAAGSATITLTPPTPNPALIGDDINFALVINATDMVPGVAGVDIYLTYDPTYVVPSSSPLGVVEPLPDFFGPSNITWYEIQKPCTVHPGAGLPCIHLVAAGPAQETHSAAVARFHFQAILVTPPGGTSFTVPLTPKMVVDANGFPVVPPPLPPAPISVSIVNRIVTGTVLRQGMPIAGLPPGTLACSEVRLIGSGGAAFGPFFTSSTGAFTLTNPPSGVQTLQAKYPGYLPSEKMITISTGGPSSINVGATTLRGGDVINSNVAINILDVGTIISKYNASGVDVRSDPPDCADPDEPIDINDDGIIDISDLGILAGANWGLAGAQPWLP